MTSHETRSGSHGELRKKIDPARSACVLIGVDDYSVLDPLRSVRHNLSELRSVLTNERILGIPPDRIFSVENPTSAAGLVRPIREAAKLATDTLIVYYAGHGLLDRGDEEHLYLTLPDSVEDQPETSVPDSYIRRAIRDSTAARRVLLLDCCYSGKVLKGGMSAADRGVRASGKALAGVSGAYVMTSSSETRKSHAPDPKRCTAFTEELVGVLRNGVADGPAMLGLHEIFEAVRARMAGRQLPQPQEPQDRDDGGIGWMPFAHNIAVAPPPWPTDQETPAADPSRRRRWALAVGALALGVTAGATIVPAAADWWQERNPQQAGGTCSKRAELLSYSDALDKQQVSGEKVEGVSALALTGPNRVLALTDNAPGRVFPLDLGETTRLRPRALTATTLRTPSGTAPSKWFDGEGLAVERGGRTILVASETGPMVRRFNLATGKQVGKALPIPEEFRARPRGDAQAGRTLESLALSEDGRHLYTATEGPLATDGDARGRNLIRIQRYRGTPGGDYELDRQYAYKTGEGMYLAELAAVGKDRLLALERQYVAGTGNTVRVYDVPLRGAENVDEHTALYDQHADVFIENSLLVDLAKCPAGDPGVVPMKGKQLNPLLQNVEGMALGKPWTTGPYKGHRPLYLVADDNDSDQQITRLYALSVRL
ncbi:caspase, EACC1-associated type [Streptomyces violens]|uniref:caspase, EACC1-associated type n=1 Tax=Streptomyces violens TaxID=66377 RepID=UPI0004C05948|nr:esterase-like activity of phytase family protein [Streptomyces violens]